MKLFLTLCIVFSVIPSTHAVFFNVDKWIPKSWQFWNRNRDDQQRLRPVQRDVAPVGGGAPRQDRLVGPPRQPVVLEGGPPAVFVPGGGATRTIVTYFRSLGYRDASLLEEMVARPDGYPEQWLGQGMADEAENAIKHFARLADGKVKLQAVGSLTASHSVGIWTFGQILMSHLEIAVLLAKMLTDPTRFYTSYHSRGYFAELLSKDVDRSGNNHFRRRKLFCILGYFVYIHQTDDHILEKEVVTFTRAQLKIDSRGYTGALMDLGYRFGNAEHLTPVVVHDKPIESISGGNVIEVDFANRYIGGGVLRNGFVQEEILFVLKPECLAAIYLSPHPMSNSETILIENAHQFAEFNYRDSKITRFHDLSWHHNSIVVAIDAIDQRGKDPKSQFEGRENRRDILKAVIGVQAALEFSRDKSFEAGVVVSTGKWGGGIFRNDNQLKFVQQWIAFSDPRIQTIQYSCFSSGCAHSSQEMQFVDRCTRKHKHNRGTLLKRLHSQVEGSVKTISSGNAFSILCY